MKIVDVDIITRISIILCFTGFSFLGEAQISDTLSNLPPQKHRNIFQFGINAITKSDADTSMRANVINIRSVEPFIPYQGKIIRNIFINQLGFEKTFTDTTKKIDYFGKKISNHLHRNTRDWVIRNNLFIRENQPLNASLVADNERHLRSLEFIQDARILISPITTEKDSIDIVVVTKDIFEIIAELNNLTLDHFKAKIGDVNLLGMGQKISFTALLQKDRNPNFGYEIYYSKNNIANTFINATAGYTSIKQDLAQSADDEHSWYLKLEQPLASQYLHFAGAITFAGNESYNNYSKPDSMFYKYHYNTFDMWAGYNLGLRKLLLFKSKQNREFVSLRYFHNPFLLTPYQVAKQFNFNFNSREAILGQFTFFKQNFYKTNYIFGFGITEDVPYGYNIALTTGWYKQWNQERLYAGVDANRYLVTTKGDVMQYFLRTGTFVNDGKLEDAAMLMGTTIFSRLHFMNKTKMRQYLQFSYTRQFNRVSLYPLSIGNVFGLRNYNLDSASGNQRISLHAETFFFLKYKMLGFKFAPFTAGDIVLLTSDRERSKNGWYYAIGGGVRTRNENLIFKTIELRFSYFPRQSQQNNTFKVTLNSSIRFRYNSNYVKAPDIIQLNNDYENNIY
ncbi:hypothetical protein [Segetibacter koreensis]|uniref:hypothetical protein n=1 Tax=Segetibacter koreensis TaxID=398037 RepID=UPI001FDF742D|nr:hypothetical protein [Segetibacter koreensis]